MYKSLILCVFSLVLLNNNINSQCTIEVNNNGFEYNVDIDLNITGAIFSQEGSTCNVEIELEYEVEIEVINQPGWWNESLYVLQGNLDCAGASGTSFFNLPNGGGIGVTTSATFSYDNENCDDVTIDCPITIDIQGPELNTSVDCGSYLRAALPIILASMDAEYLGEKVVELKWTTQSEINFSHFEVLTSDNLKAWKSNTIIEGNNILSGGQYSHVLERTDQDSYARLKMIDIDGSYDYSDVILLKGNTETSTSVYPNPTTGMLYFSGNKIEQVFITSSTGIVHKYFVGDSQSIDVSDLASGIYLLQTTNMNGTTQSIKFIKK